MREEARDETDLGTVALVILFGSPPTKEGVVPKYIAQEVEALPR